MFKFCDWKGLGFFSCWGLIFCDLQMSKTIHDKKMDGRNADALLNGVP